MIDTLKYEFQFSLPEWTSEFYKSQISAFNTTESRMALAIELSKKNIENQTGGPFGAAIFDQSTGQLISIGINCVVPEHCSVLHAEIVAILLAHDNIKMDNNQILELYTSAEPCVMCIGAVLWSGINHLYCGARTEDVERIGFDEGPKPDHWVAELKNRGIAVTRDVMRDEAIQVLQDYKKKGGIIYNGIRDEYPITNPER